MNALNCPIEVIGVPQPKPAPQHARRDEREKKNCVRDGRHARHRAGWSTFQRHKSSRRSGAEQGEIAVNYRLLAAAVILALYLTLAIVILLQAAGWEGPAWDHALAIFASFGAIATAAASVLLGVEVQQGNVDSARKEASAATAQYAALAEAHRIALDTLSAPATTDNAGSPEGRLAQVRDLLSTAGART